MNFHFTCSQHVTCLKWGDQGLRCEPRTETVTLFSTTHVLDTLLVITL